MRTKIFYGKPFQQAILSSLRCNVVHHSTSSSSLKSRGATKSFALKKSFSSVAAVPSWDDGDLTATLEKHCNTCTCESHKTNIPIVKQAKTTLTTTATSPKPFPCGNHHHEDEFDNLPPPLPEPKYSVHKRILPSSLTRLSSPEGREFLVDAFREKSAESYWALSEQFVNQTDPAYCGVTTLLMVLNSMCVDPQVRWRGGWRFYGSEDVLLDRCCLSAERIRRIGVTMEEFLLLGRCHGLGAELKRPEEIDTRKSFTIDEFRDDIKRIQKDADDGGSIIVVSFSRQHLGQTGDGHFSPLAAYHEATDQVLVLDVARFKYAPYWVSVEELYESMKPHDSATKRSRGWFLLHPPRKAALLAQEREDRRPAGIVPQVGEKDACPVGKVKVDFCKANPHAPNS